MNYSDSYSLFEVNKSVSEVQNADVTTQNSITINDNGIQANGIEGAIVALGAAIAMCIGAYNLTKN